MTLVATGGIAAAIATWFDADLLLALLVAAAVVVVAMRTHEARVRLAPVLVVLAGLSVTVAASQLRTWF